MVSSRFLRRWAALMVVMMVVAACAAAAEAGQEPQGEQPDEDHGDSHGMAESQYGRGRLGFPRTVGLASPESALACTICRDKSRGAKLQARRLLPRRAQTFAAAAAAAVPPSPLPLALALPAEAATAAGEDPCAQEALENYDLGLHIGAIGILLGVSLLGSLAPVALFACAHRFRATSRRPHGRGSGNSNGSSTAGSFIDTIIRLGSYFGELAVLSRLY